MKCPQGHFDYPSDPKFCGNGGATLHSSGLLRHERHPRSPNVLILPLPDDVDSDLQVALDLDSLEAFLAAEQGYAAAKKK